MTGREGGHPHEEGRVGVGQQEYVAAPAAEQGGHQEPRSAAYDRVGGEQGHQKRLGDQVPRGEPDGQGNEVHGSGHAEGDEQHARVPWAHATGSVTAWCPADFGVGCQPGPRKTRPARSRQPVAAFRSLAMAAYSWVATRRGLYVAMFLVSP